MVLPMPKLPAAAAAPKPALGGILPGMSPGTDSLGFRVKRL